MRSAALVDLFVAVTEYALEELNNLIGNLMQAIVELVKCSHIVRPINLVGFIITLLARGVVVGRIREKEPINVTPNWITTRKPGAAQKRIGL